MQTPDEWAKLREQLTQSQNAFAQKERELAEKDEQLRQTQHESACFQAALQKERQENKNLCQLNDLLLQERKTYQNIEQTQPVSTHRRGQGASVGGAQQPQQLEDTPSQRCDVDELIRGSE